MAEPPERLPGRITLAGLEFHGYHGVFSEEQTFGARFLVDTELHVLLPAEDDLSQTVDYGAVYALIQEEVTAKRYRLLETLAQRLAERILQAFADVLKVTVRVHKPHAPLPGIFRDVIVEVHRRR
jgi:dihydroneopterin aldolase